MIAEGIMMSKPNFMEKLLDEENICIKDKKRRSIRLKGYDYSQPGMYYVTICTQNRFSLFGEINNGKMVLNDAGNMVVYWYGELSNKFPDIKQDQCIVMPNHVHFILHSVGVDCVVSGGVGADLRVCPDEKDNVCPDDVVDYQNTQGKQNQNVQGEHIGSPLRDIIQWFKTMTTNEYIRGVKKYGWIGFPGKLWQRNYYEHIICNEKELNRIRKYIIDNPINWQGNDIAVNVKNVINVGADLRVCPNKKNNVCPNEKDNVCPNDVCDYENIQGEHIGSPIQNVDKGLPIQNVGIQEGGNDE